MPCLYISHSVVEAASWVRVFLAVIGKKGARPQQHTTAPYYATAAAAAASTACCCCNNRSPRVKQECRDDTSSIV